MHMYQDLDTRAKWGENWAASMFMHSQPLVHAYPPTLPISISQLLTPFFGLLSMLSQLAKMSAPIFLIWLVSIPLILQANPIVDPAPAAAGTIPTPEIKGTSSI